MKKLMLASMTLLLAGATAVPAFADDDKRSVGGSYATQGGKGPWREDREERREDRRDDRQDRRDDRREWRAERRDDRHDWREDRREIREDRRDHRQDWRAERRDDRRDWRDDRRDWRDDRRDWRHDRRDDYRHRYSRHDDRRWSGYHWRPEYRYRAPRYVYPSGYRSYRWQVGHRLPPAYYGRPYYVDYRHYRLPPPPYGYHWVRVDRDVVLVAAATGLILDVLYGLYY
ncbi:RcnB family protein [Arenimonas malthae]|nr:RcnB family protein [Arenimonas malthae]